MTDDRHHWDALARDYHANVITPFSPEVDFRFEADVMRSLAAWRRQGTLDRTVVMDFGCGCGEALAAIAGTAGFSVGIDFSEGMLTQTQRRLEARGIAVTRYPKHAPLSAVTADIARFRAGQVRAGFTALANADLLSLEALRGAADCAFAINSIVPESTEEARAMLGQIAAALRPGGTLFAVLPSLDTMTYLFDLFEKYDWENDVGTIDSEAGIFIDSRGERQKYYTPEEIESLFGSESLEVDLLEKIRYPWRQIERYGWGYFPSHRRLWDWYVIGRRTVCN